MLLGLALATSMLDATPSASVQLLEPVIEVASIALRSSTRPPPQPFDYVGEVDYAPPSFTIDPPATKRAQKLYDLAYTIDDTRTDTTYTHGTKVRRREGLYHFDCSGMMNWMLARVSPKALETLDRERPVAATYVRTIQKAPTSKRRGGWQRVAAIADVRPGDIFAWKRPADWPKGGNTGHVGIVVANPEPVPFIEHAYSVRVIDSTRYAHQHDDRYDTGATGFGFGTILFMADDQDAPVGYGWFGTQSGGWYATDVVFGRI